MGEWRYFEWDEFECKHTGRNQMNHEFISKLDELRERCGFAFHITSGYRDPSHPAEANKAGGPGTHAQGIAVDIAARGWKMRRIVAEAMEMGFGGIGIGSGFVHVDDRATEATMWGYR